MAEIVTMPKLGFDMAEGTLVRWVINEGENVTKGAVLAEIETDKATVEVESTHEGVLLRHLVQQGTAVPVNDPIAVVGAAGEEVDVDTLLGQKDAAVQPKAAPPPTDTEKPAEAAPQKPAQEPTAAPQVEAAPVSGEPPTASPLARSMASELGIDLRSVRGSGPGGRITKKDIEVYQQKAPEITRVEPPSAAPTPATAPKYAPAPAQVFVRETRNVPLPKLRAAIGRRMAESMQQAPHFYVTHLYDVGRLMELRQEINALLDEDDRLSVNDFIVKAVALTLLEFPNLNASIDLKNASLVYHGEINVGVAVAVENGLLTVVNRNTDQKSIRQISAELKVVVKRAREGKVRPDDIEGSTFTVSNMGMYDVDQFTAIINPPEAAILAVGSALQTPVVVEGEIKVGLRMKATLSVDHRVSDGAEGARFMQALAKYIEAPMRLLI
jgi:pyruvate dehydrogenase E2 component (dihydrolipoamide acetyltransferase)